MSALLTSRQADELHKSLIAYLNSAGYSKAAQTIREELNVPEETFDAATAKKYEGLLERKWTSVVRLQKKIMDLETQTKQLQHELDNATPTSLAARRNHDPATWLPRAPARHTLQSHRQPITCVAFHPLFSSLASGSEDCTIKIWDYELGELERTLKSHTKAVLDVDFGGPRGNTLLASCSSDLTIKLWDPSDEYKNIRTLPGHDHSVSSVRFIPSGAAGAPLSGNLLASASRDKTIRIWDVTTGYCLRTLRGHGDWVRSLHPTVDGRWLVSTSSDQTARMWDLSQPESNSLKQTFLAHEHVVECCAFAPTTAYKNLASIAGLKKPPPASSSAEYLATGGRDKQIKLFGANGVCIKTLTGHDNWIRALVFHPGGKYLLSCSDDKTIRCWDLSQEGKCVRVVEAADHFVSCLRWAPSVFKENSGAADGAAQKNGDAVLEQIRCLVACGSVDLNHHPIDEGNYNTRARKGQGANTQTSHGAATHHLLLRNIHEPWPTLISNERPNSRFATFDEPWPALNPNDRPYSRLATLAPRQRAFLITDRNDLDEPQLICAHQLSLVNKQLRTELCDWLRTASEVPVVTRVTGLDFQHVIHFLSSLGKNQKNAMRVRPDGTFGMSLTIELEGPYTASSMENLQRWIEYVDAFVGLERRAELGTVYKTIDRDGLDHKAFTVIVIRPSQPYDAELSRCIPLTVLENVREYHEGIARGGGEVDLEKILAALYCCWSLDWM